MRAPSLGAIWLASGLLNLAIAAAQVALGIDVDPDEVRTLRARLGLPLMWGFGLAISIALGPIALAVRLGFAAHHVTRNRDPR